MKRSILTVSVLTPMLLGALSAGLPSELSSKTELLGEAII